MFKVVSQKGFLKGVISSMDRFNVTKGAIQRSSNFLLSQRGALTVCDGTAVFATDTSGSSPGSPIQEMALFIDPNNLPNPYPMAAAPGGGNTMGIYQWSFSPISSLTNIQAIPNTPGWDMPQMLNFAGVLVIACGNGTPMVKMSTLPSLGGSFTQLGGGAISGGGRPLAVIPSWQPNTFYQIGQRVAEPDGNSILSTWQVVTVNISGVGGTSSTTTQNTSGVGSGGMSGATEPNFGNDEAAVKGAGQIAHDNQIIWQCIAQDKGNLAKTFPPLGAAHIIEHANSLWAWNTSPITTTGAEGSMDGPSVLRMSDPNNADSWPIGNTTIVGKDDGSQGTGLATFTVAEAGITPSGQLVAFKDYSTYTITGVFQASDFATNQVKTDMGCLAPRSIQFATGFGVIRFCHVGFALFDGINDRLISEEVRTYIFGDRVTPGVDFARMSKAQACLTVNPPLYVCSMPTVDGKTTRVFCYDLVMRAWMIIDYMNSSSAYPLTCMRQLRPPQVSGRNAQSFLADFGPGNIASIRQFQAGDQAWDATNPPTPIAWSFRPPEVGEPGSRAYFRRANIRLTAPGPGQITGSFNIGEESQPNNIQQEGGAGPSSGTAPNIATTATYYGNEDLGVALDVHQTGPSLNGTYSGSGPANIEGVDYHINAKQPRPFGQRF